MVDYTLEGWREEPVGMLKPQGELVIIARSSLAPALKMLKDEVDKKWYAEA